MSHKTKSSSVSDALSQLSVLNNSIYSKRQELGEVEKVIKEKASATADAASLKNAVGELKAEKEGLDSVISALRAAGKEVEAASDKKRVYLGELAQAQKGLEWDIEKSKGDLAVVEQKKAKSSAEKKAEIAELKKEKDSISQQLKQEKGELSGWKKKVVDASKQFQKIADKKESLSDIEAAIRERGASLKAVNVELSDAAKKYEKISANVEKELGKVEAAKEQQKEEKEKLKTISEANSEALGEVSLREELIIAREDKLERVIAKVEKQLGKKINI